MILIYALSFLAFGVGLYFTARAVEYFYLISVYGKSQKTIVEFNKKYNSLLALQNALAEEQKEENTLVT